MADEQTTSRTSTPSGCSRRRSTSASPSPTGPCRRCRTAPRATSRAAGGEGSSWYQGGGAVGDRAVQGITIYPPTRRRADPGRPVRAGEDRDPHRHGSRTSCSPTGSTRRSSPSRTRSTRASTAAARSSSSIADARGLPRENYRKVIDGYRWLVEQGCVVVLGPMISRQLARAAGHRQRARRRLHRLDRRPQVRVRVLLHRGQRRHPDRGRDVRAVAEGAGASRRSACSGSRARRARTTPTTSATPRCSSA